MSLLSLTTVTGKKELSTILFMSFNIPHTLSSTSSNSFSNLLLNLLFQYTIFIRDENRSRKKVTHRLYVGKDTNYRFYIFTKLYLSRYPNEHKGRGALNMQL